jgi:3-oxoacyl-[acyl-carrier protein] reductase
MSEQPRDFAARTGTALVVGGSGGIGLAVARLLARRGSAVAVTYRHDEAAAAKAVASAREWGVRGAAYRLDLDPRVLALVREPAETR